MILFRKRCHFSLAHPTPSSIGASCRSAFWRNQDRSARCGLICIGTRRSAVSAVGPPARQWARRVGQCSGDEESEKEGDCEAKSVGSAKPDKPRNCADHGGVGAVAVRNFVIDADVDAQRVEGCVLGLRSAWLPHSWAAAASACPSGLDSQSGVPRARRRPAACDILIGAGRAALAPSSKKSPGPRPPRRLTSTPALPGPYSPSHAPATS